MRNPIFDIMKGVALLLMLVGHMAIPEDGLLYEFIYSFHMPLFFLIAGYFAKSYEETQMGLFQFLWKDTKRLLVPYLITAFVIILFTAVRACTKHDVSIVADRAMRLGYVTYDAIPIWFLVALFWARTIFRPFMKLGRWALPLAVVLSGSAIVVIHHVVQLPFCILTALAAMVFYAIGWWCKQYGIPWWIIVVCLLCWPYAIFWSRIDLYFIRYGIYPLTVLGACGGTYVIYWACKGLYLWSQNINHKLGKGLYTILHWVGINSLIILCFHSIDIYCCWLTMALKGLFNLELSYWPVQLLRDASVLLFSWLYVTYIRPYIVRMFGKISASKE